MRIEDFQIFRYSLPISPPLHIKHHYMRRRVGFIIRIENERGNHGYGEVAPLPGVHKEDLLSALQQIKKLRQAINSKKIPPRLSRLEGAFGDWLSELRLFPSVQLGIEMAVLNLEAHTYEDSLFPSSYSSGAESLKLNGLLKGNLTDRKGITPKALKQVEKLLKDGYDTVKVKVGRKSIDDDIKIVNGIIELAGERLRLRLDSNRAWTLKQAVEFGKAIPTRQIEYIEEPVRIPKASGQVGKRLNDFYQQTGIPIALDESLSEMPIDGFKPFEGLVAFVIKPGVVGGLEKTKAWVETARMHQLNPVLSCPFLSGLGVATIANLASQLKLNHLAMGLDTYKWFKTDLLEKPLKVKNGEMHVATEYRKSYRIREELLQRV